MTVDQSVSPHTLGGPQFITGKKRRFSETSQSNDPLHTVGYKVFKSAVDISDPIKEAIIKHSQKAQPIFNYNESKRNDFKRRQANITVSNSNKLFRDFLRTLDRFVQDHVSDVLKLSKWVVIHSKPGCQDQAAHCDYIPNIDIAKVSDEKMPLSIIVTIMPGTRLNVWPNSIKLATFNDALLKQVKPIKCKVVKLNPGEIFIFRGDLIHAGSSYESDNYRLHAFLDSDLVPRTPNRTWVVHGDGTQSLKNAIIPKNISK